MPALAKIFLRSFLFRAFGADAADDNPRAGHGEGVPDVRGKRHIVKSCVAEIDDLAASDAVKMVMVSNAGIEPPGERVGLDHVDNADLGEGQERSVHRVERDGRPGAGDFTVNPVRRWVIGAAHQQIVDGHALRGDFQARLTAALDERFHGSPFVLD